MNENDDTQTAKDASIDPASDPRFEVKWRKKPQSTPTPPADASKPAATETADGDPAALERELEEARARVQELQDKWHRSAAEVANLRRRHEQERGDMEKMASMSLVYDLLPVVDNFQRAIASVPGNLGGLTWIHGVILIERQMKAILESRGVTPIEAMGKPFDPHYHEAVSERETDEAAPNTVVSEYQQGYVMHGYVIRPALVEVAKAPVTPSQKEAAPPADATETDTSDGEEISDEAQEQNVGP